MDIEQRALMPTEIETMTFDQVTGVYTISPEDRVRALLYYFGWQGGTIHQLAAETGCSAGTLLYAPIAKVGDGFSAVRTCSLEWRRDKLAPKYKGDWSYWAGVIVGFWATGALDEAA